MESIESVLVIDGGPGQHHGVVIGPFGSITPPLLVAVPEVAAGWVTNDAVWETLPHCESKVHLEQDQREMNRDRERGGGSRHEARGVINKKNLSNMWSR